MDGRMDGGTSIGTNFVDELIMLVNWGRLLIKVTVCTWACGWTSPMVHVLADGILKQRLVARRFNSQ